MSLLSEHTFCGHCGTRFSENGRDNGCQTLSLHCHACGKMTYLNPKVVGVILLPVDEGMLVVRRKDSGKLALPGGYLEQGESWQEGMARELWEETGIVVPAEDISLFEVKSTPNGSLLLLFGLAKPQVLTDLPPFMTNSETTETCILTRAEPLAFPLHTCILERFFAEKTDTARNHPL